MNTITVQEAFDQRLWEREDVVLWYPRGEWTPVSEIIELVEAHRDAQTHMAVAYLEYDGLGGSQSLACLEQRTSLLRYEAFDYDKWRREATDMIHNTPDSDMLELIAYMREFRND